MPAVDPGIIAMAFDPVDLLDRNPDELPAAVRPEAVYPLLSGPPPRAPSAHRARAWLSPRLLEPRLGDGLQQIIGRRDVEGLDRMLVMRGDEDDRGADRGIDPLDHLEPVEPRHRDVDKDEVRASPCRSSRPRRGRWWSSRPLPPPRRSRASARGAGWPAPRRRRPGRARSPSGDPARQAQGRAKAPVRQRPRFEAGLLAEMGVQPGADIGEADAGLAACGRRDPGPVILDGSPPFRPARRPRS